MRDSRSKLIKRFILIFLLFLFISYPFCHSISYTPIIDNASINKSKLLDNMQSIRNNFLPWGLDPMDLRPYLNKIGDLPGKEIAEIQILAVGDVMMHSGQIRSGYNKANDSYNFDSFFKAVEPYVAEADLSIANLETTLAGKKQPYSGYPRFSSPDDLVDSLKSAGFNTIITANNHSLDTGLEGLKRTREIIIDRSLAPVGTYDESSGKNYLLTTVEGIRIALVSYTEHANGLEKAYSPETLTPIINIIQEEKIISDLEAIKKEDPDLIIAYMHWGHEYRKTASEFQQYYAKLLTKEGVNIILGSHPHVIQPSEKITIDDNESIVFYSLGNFISNQRRETLGDNYKATEDGVMVSFNIQKNFTKNETIIQEINTIPTWVHRFKTLNKSTYSYEILPIESYLSRNPDLNASLKKRLNNSYDSTKSRLDLE